MEGTGLRITANDQFKRSSSAWTRVGLLAAVGLHFGLFVLVSPFEAAEMGAVAREMISVELPPEIDMPDPPAPIQRPAKPRVGAVEVPDHFTIEPTTDLSAARSNLPPPPATGRAGDRPSFIPFDTSPQLLNAAEVEAQLRRAYPRSLMDASIGGRVELWIYVSEAGAVENWEVKTSSGYPLLDRAAGEVVLSMKFSPARNRDRPTGVWVSQAVTFGVT